MPISLSELQGSTRSLTIDYDGQMVTVVYKPGLLTPSNSEEFVRQSIVDQLDKLLVSWDVMDDKGKPLPITAELLNQLPGRFLAHIAESVSGDMRPNVKRAAS